LKYKVNIAISNAESLAKKQEYPDILFDVKNEPYTNVYELIQWLRKII